MFYVCDFLKNIFGIRAVAGGGGALLGAALLLGAAPIPDPAPAPVQARTIAGSPDDLSSKVCTGTAATHTQIETPDGVVPTVYALAGDTLDFYGETKACQNVITPADALEWGFTASEIAWTLRPAVGAAQPLGAGTVLKEGRDTVPNHQPGEPHADDGGRQRATVLRHPGSGGVAQWHGFLGDGDHGDPARGRPRPRTGQGGLRRRQ
ncbi:hypothetical protein Lxx04380 [Leifsonia xyli subsp. xyli str. CTCB07]|uniref:Uncharacterized protein n=1 Tax=Leifsonia xyli subsp. xyli (strain CTCB07) TaxID=281090 RepID=Q6AGR3_LEIXX|nr:hypothetical protein Lxx04380 [Leifsonia xyli subsp. xyli str. CTCB07]